MERINRQEHGVENIRDKKIEIASGKIRELNDIDEHALKKAREENDYYKEKLIAKIIECKNVGEDHKQRLDELDRYGLRSYGE